MIILFLIPQAYRQNLADFRSSVLPRSFTRSFQETPEPGVMRGHLSEVNDRMDALKTSSSAVGEHLMDLVSKHEHYNSAVDGFNEWCVEAERRLVGLEKEPAGSEPVFIQKQIDRVKVRATGIQSLAVCVLQRLHSTTINLKAKFMMNAEWREVITLLLY